MGLSNLMLDLLKLAELLVALWPWVTSWWLKICVVVYASLEASLAYRSVHDLWPCLDAHMLTLREYDRCCTCALWWVCACYAQVGVMVWHAHMWLHGVVWREHVWCAWGGPVISHICVQMYGGCHLGKWHSGFCPLRITLTHIGLYWLYKVSIDWKYKSWLAVMTVSLRSVGGHCDSPLTRESIDSTFGQLWPFRQLLPNRFVSVARSGLVLFSLISNGRRVVLRQGRRRSLGGTSRRLFCHSSLCASLGGTVSWPSTNWVSLGWASNVLEGTYLRLWRAVMKGH